VRGSWNVRNGWQADIGMVAGKGDKARFLGFFFGANR
jgi:hypothetical protein